MKWSYLGVALLTLLSGCRFCPVTCPVIDCCDYTRIDVGDSLDDLRCRAGEPFEVICCPDGRQRYVYVSRDDMASNVNVLRRYVFVIDGGCVVDKWCEQEQEQEFSLMDAHFTKDLGR